MMGTIKVTANPDPAGPALKIEYQGAYPAGNGVHYADEWNLTLDPWIRLEKPRLREMENPAAAAKAAPPAPAPDPAPANAQPEHQECPAGSAAADPE